MAGCSNREIALRTVEHCSRNRYDFCIVQWSALHRYWLYESDCNIDNETQILPKVCGWTLNDPEDASTISKILTSRYLNDYMALKHWFLDQISLQTFLKNNRIKYVFVRGHSNFINDFENLSQQDSFDAIPQIHLPSTIKKMLNFEDNPDDYLLEKLCTIVSLYKLIDKSNCIGYNEHDSTFGINTNLYSDDWADDGKHPGAIRNKLLAETILEYCKKKGIEI